MDVAATHPSNDTGSNATSQKAGVSHVEHVEQVSQVGWRDIKTVALVVEEPKADFTLKPIILDEIRPDEILIEMKYSGICMPGDPPPMANCFGFCADGRQVTQTLCCNKGSYRSLFEMSDYREFHRVCLAYVNQMFQQISGINLITYYAPVCLLKATFTSCH